jgi:hypothetical protein
MTTMMFHLDLLPITADPEGSVRYSNVNICHEKLECKHEDTTFYDDIAKTNTFIIDDRSPQYKGYECCMFKGVVIKEANGSYCWWKSIDQKGMISNEDSD